MAAQVSLKLPHLPRAATIGASVPKKNMVLSCWLPLRISFIWGDVPCKSGVPGAMFSLCVGSLEFCGGFAASLSFRKPFGFGKKNKPLRIQTGIGWSSPIPSQDHYSSNCKNWFKNEKYQVLLPNTGIILRSPQSHVFLCSSWTPRTYWLFVPSTCNVIKSPQQNGSDGQKW